MLAQFRGKFLPLITSDRMQHTRVSFLQRHLPYPVKVEQAGTVYPSRLSCSVPSETRTIQ